MPFSSDDEDKLDDSSHEVIPIKSSSMFTTTTDKLNTRNDNNVHDNAYQKQ